MSKTLYIVIPGEVPPAPRPRARVVKLGKNSFAQIYTPSKGSYAMWKRSAAVIMDQVRRGYCGSRAFVSKDTPLEVRILVVSRLAKTHERKTLAKQPPRKWQVLDIGDADNVAKGPLDAAKGVLWHDDRQVASLSIEQVVGAQGEPARCEILLWALEAQECRTTNFEQSRRSIRESGELVEAVSNEGSQQWPTERTGNLPF